MQLQEKVQAILDKEGQESGLPAFTFTIKGLPVLSWGKTKADAKEAFDKAVDEAWDN